MRLTLAILAASGLLGLGSAARAQDGVAVGGGSLPLFVQDTATGFGNATGGGQDSSGGSEINAVYGDYDAGTGTLNIGLTGNLEGNFNKLFLFLDGVAGGENSLDGTNLDGGFNEIQNLSGLTFDSGFTADHGLRFEIGSGFVGVNSFDLIDDTAVSVTSAGGPGDLPLVSAGTGGILVGWDNSNILGVDDITAAGALTATTGIELQIDAASLFGAVPTQDIGIAGFITSSDAGFVSNQVIGGLGPGAANLGAGGGIDFSSITGNQFVTVNVPTVAIPEPSSVALLGLVAGGAMSRRRRR